VQQLLDAMDNVPAFVQNGRLDIVAINRLAQAVFSEMYVQPLRPANFGRFVFSTREPRRSTATGRTPPSRPLPSCAPRPADGSEPARLGSTR
jgi:hypothetical protein